MADITNTDHCYPDFDNRKHTFEDCKCVDDPNSVNGDDCIAKWKAEEASAKASLDQAIAEEQARSEALKYAAEWETKLKKYFDNIYQTSALAEKVASELVVLKAQTQGVCTNAYCTIEALEILFCEVNCMFEPHVRTVVQIMDRVNECIKCITDPGLVREEGILKVLAEYDEKLRELEGMHVDALKKILDAIKCANILYYSLCEAPTGGTTDNSPAKQSSQTKTRAVNGGPSEKEEFPCDSLTSELAALCLSFGSVTPEPGKPPTYSAPPLRCDLPDSTDPNAPVVASNYPRDLEPVPVFPLKSDPYYLNTEVEYTTAQQDKADKQTALDEAKKAKQAAQACYNSLVKAIETAEKAKKS